MAKAMTREQALAIVREGVEYENAYTYYRKYALARTQAKAYSIVLEKAYTVTNTRNKDGSKYWIIPKV